MSGAVQVHHPKQIMQVRGRLLTGAVWISGARVITNLLGLISTLVLARLLTPGDFGLVALGTTFSALITAVSDIPVTEALIQHRDPSQQHFHTAFTIGLARALIIGTVMFIAAWPLAHVYKDHRIVDVVVVLALGVMLGGLGNPRAIMMTKNLIFWQQFMLQVAQRLTALVVAVVVAIVFRSFWALLLGTLAGQIVNVVVSYTVLPFRPRFSLMHHKELLSFSIWLTLCQIVMSINFRLDQLLIGSFIGKAQLGYYVVGDNLASMPTREATSPLVTTVFPAFSRLTDDRQRLAAAYTKAQAFITAVVLPIGVGVAIVADPLVRLVMGERWLPAIFIIQALSAVFALQTIGTLAQPLAMAAGETRLLFKRDLQGLLYRVPLIFIGLYFGGLPGVVYARVFSGTTSIVFTTNVVTKITGLTLWKQISMNIRSLVGCALMAPVAIALYRIIPSSLNAVDNLAEIALLVACGAATYLSASALLWWIAGRPDGPETEILSLAKRGTEMGRQMMSIAKT